MSNYNQSSNYVPGVPQQSYTPGGSYATQSNYVPGVPQQNYQHNDVPSINTYNQIPQYNNCYGSSVNSPSRGYEMPPTGMPAGGYGVPPSMPDGGYGYPSNMPGGGYGVPTSMPGGGYGVPPSMPGEGYGVPPSMPSGGYGVPPSMPGGGYCDPPSMSGGGYCVPPNMPVASYPQDNEGYINQSAKVYPDQMSIFRSNKKEKDVKVVPESAPPKVATKSSSAANDKSEYQKGLDRLAALMDEDVSVSEDKLKTDREKYDLNKAT